MIALKMLLTFAGVLLLAAALEFHCINLYSASSARAARPRKRRSPARANWPKRNRTRRIPWRGPLALVLVACLPLLVAASIVVVPADGWCACEPDRRHHARNALSGVHFVTPFVESIETSTCAITSSLQALWKKR